MSQLVVSVDLWAKGMQEHRIPLLMRAGDPLHHTLLLEQVDQAVGLAILQRLCGASPERVERLAACRGLSVSVVCDLLLAGNAELAEQMGKIKDYDKPI